MKLGFFRESSNTFSNVEMNQLIETALQNPDITELQRTHLNSAIVQKQLAEKKVTITEVIERCPKEADGLHVNQKVGIKIGLTLSHVEHLSSFTNKQMKFLNSNLLLMQIINNKLTIKQAIALCADERTNELKPNAFSTMLRLIKNRFSKEEAFAFFKDEKIIGLDNKLINRIVTYIIKAHSTINEAFDFCTNERIRKLKSTDFEEISERIFANKLTEEDAIAFCADERISDLDKLQLAALLDGLSTYDEVIKLDEFGIEGLKLGLSNEQVRQANAPLVNGLRQDLSFDEVKHLGMKEENLSNVIMSPATTQRYSPFTLYKRQFINNQMQNLSSDKDNAHDKDEVHGNDGISA